MAALFDVPNLDGMTVDDLTETSKVLAKLAAYAKIKSEAMRTRAAGYITNAVHKERKCDAIYSELPKWARW